MPTTDAETIGQRLRRLRVERGLSQRELSAPGVSYAYISRIEAGARRPSVKALRSLARKLGVTAEYLETGSEIALADERELRLADAELRIRLEGHADATIAELREVLAESRADADRMSAARAQIALGLAAHEAGRHDEAIALLESAVGTDVVSPASRPDAYASLGRSYAATGRADRAVALFEECLDRVTEEMPQDTATQVRYATYLSHALTDASEFARARLVLEHALAHAEDNGDPYTRIRLYWSLGRLAMNEGKPIAALSYFRRATALLEATEDTLHLARAYLSCGWVMIEVGEAAEAGAQLDRAEQLLGDRAEPVDRVLLHTQKARRALKLGDPRTALVEAKASLDLAGQLFPHERGSALLTLAQALAGVHDRDAEDAFATAATHIDELGPKRLRAEAYRSWARLLRDAGRETEALDVLERATDPELVER